METIAQLSRRQVVVLSGMAGRIAWALLMLILGSVLMGASGIASAAPVSDVRMTKHNLSKFQKGATANPNTTKSTTEDQVCVFCHTPHAATAGVNPLWNRSVSTSGYTLYSNSGSLDAKYITDSLGSQPAGSSLLCLSCHDGQVALGNVNVLNGRTNAQISVNGSTTTKMPTGSGSSTGFTRHIGTDLSNDHPISVTYDNALAERDGELQALTTSAPAQRDTLSDPDGLLIGVRTSGYGPKLPLQPTGASGAGQVQCSTCHDPHLYDSADADRKFLRLNRLQKNAVPTGAFTEANDIICLACHTRMGTEWANSAHASSTVAEETYNSTAATLRGFPSNTAVWQASCLNCHDTHTVAGARRLLREGTDNTSSPKSGGASAMEETCYQCHTTAALKIISGTVTSSTNTVTDNLVPDIKTEFGRAVHMPITAGSSGDQVATDEKHEIGGNFNDTGGVNCSTSTNKCGADLIEQRSLLGHGNTGNRHVECTDCHNPHRVIRNSLFNGSGVNTQRTHTAGGTAGNSGADGNIASGVLRGIWGVEPAYDLPDAWPEADVAMTVKRGVPGAGTGRSEGWLTREYQLCFKCHSDFANSTTATAFPQLGAAGHAGGTTSANGNGMVYYTNVAGEFAVNATDPPTGGTDQGEKGDYNNNGPGVEPTGTYPADAASCFTANTEPCMTDLDTNVKYNHRSWHPATFPTGRTRDERRMSATGGNIRAPFATYVGTQTMHCSDCHGNSGGVNAGTGTTGVNSWIQGTGPNLRRTQGPHGSDSNFLLKGTWSSGTSIGSPGFCGNCHNPSETDTNGTGDTTLRNSGFNAASSEGGGGHGNAHDSKSCNRCHVAVPHGWKNKAFLVNLNCVGKEAGSGITSCDPVDGYAGYNGSTAYSVPPYYNAAKLRVRQWQPSGNWSIDSCGMNGDHSRAWMRDNASC